MGLGENLLTTILNLMIEYGEDAMKAISAMIRFSGKDLLKKVLEFLREHQDKDHQPQIIKQIIDLADKGEKALQLALETWELWEKYYP